MKAELFAAIAILTAGCLDPPAETAPGSPRPKWPCASECTMQLTENPWWDQEADVAIDPKDPDHIVVTYRERKMAAVPASNPYEEVLGRFGPGYMVVTIATSTDGGASWSRTSLPHAGNSPPGSTWRNFCATSRANALFGSHGELYLTGRGLECVANTASHGFLTMSHDGGKTWGDARLIPGSATATGTTIQGSVEPATGAIAVAWDGDTIFAAVTRNGGESWTTRPIAFGGAESVVGNWTDPVWAGDGALHVAYIDESCSSMCINVATNPDPFSATSSWQRSAVASTSPAWRTDLRSIQDAYPVIDVHRSSSHEEARVYLSYIDAPSGNDDVFLTWSDDGGMTWAEPLSIPNRVGRAENDQFHHWMAVDENGLVFLSYFDRSADPANLNLTTTVASVDLSKSKFRIEYASEIREPGWCQNDPPTRETCWTHYDRLDASGGRVVLGWTQGTPLKPNQESWSEGHAGDRDRDVFISILRKEQHAGDASTTSPPRTGSAATALPGGVSE